MIDGFISVLAYLIVAAVGLATLVLQSSFLLVGWLLGLGARLLLPVVQVLVWLLSLATAVALYILRPVLLLAGWLLGLTAAVLCGVGGYLAACVSFLTTRTPPVPRLYGECPTPGEDVEPPTTRVNPHFGL